MAVDITRDTWDRTKHFSRVLMQQGRVQVDADFNEQVAILLHYVQTVVADLIGPYAGPQEGAGFAIGVRPGNRPNTIDDLTIGAGHYYVDGILCENDAEATYYTQADYPLDREVDELPDPPFLVYLDVWERQITAYEDPDIREVALGGADTAARTKVVWQVRLLKLDGGNNCGDIDPTWEDLVGRWRPANRGRLKAKARDPQESDLAEPCVIPPESRYRGIENQLYRVEIHRGGRDGEASFKYSRENATVVFPIRSIEGTEVTLEDLGRDSRFGLQAGDWVEIVDDDAVLQDRAHDERATSLIQVVDIDPIDLIVTLDRAPTAVVGQNPLRHPLLRRWDQRQGDPARGGLQIGNNGVVTVVEGRWFTLEEGVQILFQPPPGGEPPTEYRAGDYWLIPARTATGDVEWPGDVGNPEARPPHGVEHHFAPLAVIGIGNTLGGDCRCRFAPLECLPEEMP